MRVLNNTEIIFPSLPHFTGCADRLLKPIILPQCHFTLEVCDYMIMEEAVIALRYLHSTGCRLLIRTVNR